MFPVALSLHGVPSGRFPRFVGTMSDSDSTTPIPPRSVAFARRYCPRAAVFAPCGAGRTLRRAWILRLGPGLPAAVAGQRCRGLPRFLGVPRVRAPLFDSGSVSAPGHFGASLLPSAITTASATATALISELHHAAHTLAVYASWDGSPHRCTQDSLPGGGQPCPGRVVPAGSRWKVSATSPSLPPSPGFAWRTVIQSDRLSLRFGGRPSCPAGLRSSEMASGGLRPARPTGLAPAVPPAGQRAEVLERASPRRAAMVINRRPACGRDCPTANSAVRLCMERAP